MGSKGKPTRIGAIWGAVLAAVPAAPIAFTLAIFGTAQIRHPGVLSVTAVVAGSILVGTIIVLGGAVLGAILGSVFSQFAKKDSER